jgi:hypothetical protein
MGSFKLLAHPWWVNLLLLVPLAAYFLFRREKPELTSRELLTSAMFALSFGFVEGAVAIDLGVAVGLLSGHPGPLANIALLSADLHGQQSQPLNNLPPALLRIEVLREAASILMLLSVAILAQHTRRERFAIFLWIFALWDMGYYVALWATVRWPDSLTSADVLFFIPVPWTSQVWFPLRISILTGAVILLTRPRNRTD